MRRLSWLLAAFCFSMLFAGAAQAQDSQNTFDLFGGYSYVRPSVTVFDLDCPGGVCNVLGTSNTHVNLNGFEASGAFNITPWLGAVADFGGYFGNVQGASTHLETYMFGPQIRYPGRVSPFAHVLLGGAHESLGSSDEVETGGSVNGFAAAVGVGIDLKIASFVSVRPIQIDYLVTRFGGGTQSQPRVSAGLVIHF
jgi:Outer membrane protein beta-barrel domain